MQDLTSALAEADPGFRQHNVFFVDNAVIHKTPEVVRIYRIWGLTVFSNRAFSPEYMAIELLFHTLKQRLKKRIAENE